MAANAQLFDESTCHPAPDLHFELENQWGDNSARKIDHQVLDIRNTLALIAKKSSIARLPSPQEEALMPQALRQRLQGALKVLGGAPERCGVCIGVVDVFSRGWTQQFHKSSVVEEEVEALREHTAKMLPPGRYCNTFVFDMTPMRDLQVSNLELREFIALELMADRSVLVLRGDVFGPSDEMLRPVFRGAKTAMIWPVERRVIVDAFPDLLAQLVHHVSVDVPEIDLVLVVGLLPGVGALLVAEMSRLRPGLQVLDGGPLILERRLEGATRPVAPLQTLPIFSQLSKTPLRFQVGDDLHSLRPQFRRINGQAHLSLAGSWDLQITGNDVQLPPDGFSARRIDVPFAPQSHMGLATKVSAYEAVWYRKVFRLHSSWCALGQRVLLHVDACDWECLIIINNRPHSKHEGGYDPFVVDVTGQFGCENDVELVIRAWDPTDMGCPFTDKPPVPCDQCCTMGWQPRGKQSMNPGFIMYTAVTGLWRQSPWLEIAPECRVTRVQARADATAVDVKVDATCGSRLDVSIWPRRSVGEGIPLGEVVGPCCSEGLHVVLNTPLAAWSPDSPALFEVRVILDDGIDIVTQHFARRHVAVVGGRIHLNGVPVFMHGVLYQGYWPESLLTPPSVDAVEQDVRAIKSAGFNTVRVHAVVMGARFYTLCDEIGLFVWQDMPSSDGRVLPLWDKRRESNMNADEIIRTPESQAAFHTELRAMVAWLDPFPSVVVWVLFNEGWGQSETRETVEWLRATDPFRLVNAASGWNELTAGGGRLGDFADVHNYEDKPFGSIEHTFDWWPFDSAGRARALGEYGGLGYVREGHEWAADLSWGYGKTSQTKGKFRESLVGLVGRLLPLICKHGLAAAIYTQWSDVETEMNGLLTYDRVPKLALEVLHDEFAKRVMDEFQRCN
eukprot:TRINITY_DN64108_c0_g1_i1.p1 TRINITY_DN64108_c0_g1~~TRINITY_DN64108_c0_g1_i1.p1  ORF type:complete len:956 (+),score=108.42 TRINITY_DN64108_c0_g1_i1:168-2870(+)